jgi:hypothetical protein
MNHLKSCYSMCNLDVNMNSNWLHVKIGWLVLVTSGMRIRVHILHGSILKQMPALMQRGGAPTPQKVCSRHDLELWGPWLAIALYAARRRVLMQWGVDLSCLSMTKTETTSLRAPNSWAALTKSPPCYLGTIRLLGRGTNLFHNYVTQYWNNNKYTHVVLWPGLSSVMYHKVRLVSIDILQRKKSTAMPQCMMPWRLDAIHIDSLQMHCLLDGGSGCYGCSTITLLQCNVQWLDWYDLHSQCVWLAAPVSTHCLT